MLFAEEAEEVFAASSIKILAYVFETVAIEPRIRNNVKILVFCIVLIPLNPIHYSFVI